MVETFAAPASKVRTFVRGMGKGAFSGGVMMGILGLVTFVATGGFIGLGAMAMAVTTTSLFSGVMSVVRGNSAPHAAQAGAEINARSESSTQDRSPQLAPEQDAPQTSKKWTEAVGQRNAESRVQQILADRENASSVNGAQL